MADYDRRPRRGGGGQFNNRKRRYRDDEFDDRRPQRRRFEEPAAVQLRKQVIAIAENPVSRADEDVSSIAKTIAANYFDSDLTNGFLDLSLQLSIEQPLKIPFIAAIVLLTNAQKPEFTTEVLKKIGDKLQTSVNDGSWREVKLLLRFLATLQGLYEGEGIFPLLENLFNKAADLQTKSSEDALGLELVKIILFTIPYVMASSATGFEAQANGLLEKTDIIASTPHILENLVDPFPSIEPGASTSTESALSLMQKHMMAEAQNSWELACLPRPWKSPRTAEEEEALGQAQKHSFPTITVPEDIQVGPRSIFPEIYFSVYLEQEVETVPPASDTGSLLIRDVLSDTINILDFNRMAAAKQLIEADRYFAPDTFVKRATPFDKLRDVAGDKNTWKPEDVIVDAAFSLMLQLPAPDHKLVYYHALLTEACKLAPAAVAPSLGRAIRFLYRNIDRMDLELNKRFLDWFAHHLSNFGFTWKWTEWVDDVHLPDINQKKAFILDALEKEMRLSFAQRIRNTLPEPMQALISPEKEKEAPDFKFDDAATPFAQEGKELAAAIKRKAPAEEIDPIIQSIQAQAQTAGLPNPPVASADVYMQSICHVGSKSLSHVLAVIERCKERLLAVANTSPDCRKQILASVMEYWSSQAGVGVAIIDKLLNYHILTAPSVVEWCLIDRIDRGTLLAREWCYELIQRTTRKVVNRCKSILARIRDPLVEEDDRGTLKAALEAEVSGMKSLFATIEDALSSVATASEDGMIESSDRLREEEEQLLKIWGVRWLRVFRREVAVEEAWIREELARPLPPKPDVATVSGEAQMQDTKSETINGVDNHVHGEEGMADQMSSEIE